VRGRRGCLGDGIFVRRKMWWKVSVEVGRYLRDCCCRGGGDGDGRECGRDEDERGLRAEALRGVQYLKGEDS